MDSRKLHEHKGLHRPRSRQAFEVFRLGTIAPSLPAVLNAGGEALDPIVGFANIESRAEVVLGRESWSEKVGVDGCIDLVAWTQDASPEDPGVANVEFEAFGQLIPKGCTEFWKDTEFVAIDHTDISSGLSEEPTGKRCSVAWNPCVALDFQPLAIDADAGSHQGIERPEATASGPLDTEFHTVELVERTEVVLD